MFGTKLRQFLSAVLLERPGRRRTLDEWPVALTKSGERLAARVSNAQGDEARNREVLNHVVGIERWCQRRLRIFLGQPPVRDEYDGYRPGATAPLAEQLAAFRAARADSIALVQEVAAALPDPGEATVDHNQYGPLSVYAWIRYLDLHANWEVRRIR